MKKTFPLSLTCRTTGRHMLTWAIKLNFPAKRNTKAGMPDFSCYMIQKPEKCTK
jgi:hypothetical protein